MEAFAFRYFYFSKIDANTHTVTKQLRRCLFARQTDCICFGTWTPAPLRKRANKKAHFVALKGALLHDFIVVAFFYVVVDVGVTEDGNQNARVWLVVCMNFSVKVPVRWDLAADGSLFVHVTNFIYFRFCPFEWVEIRFLLLVLAQRKLPACFVVWLRERVFYSWRRWWIATWKNHASPSRTGGGTCKGLGGRIVFQLWGF